MSASTQRRLSQAHDHLRNGDAARAAALCEAVLARAPGNPDALWMLGSARLMEGRPAEAVTLLERALAASPTHGAALESLGLAHLMLSRFDDAERALRKAVSMPKAPPSVQMRLGVALLNQGRYDEAEVELKKALARAPGDADTLYNLGVACFERGAPDRARTWLEQCLAHAPEYADAHQRLAAMQLSAGRFREAMAHLREVVRLQPGNVAALIALGNACFETGELENARLAAVHARDLDPARSAPYGLLSRVHYFRGEYDLAAQVLEEGVRRSASTALLGTQVHLAHRMCDWPEWDASWRRLKPELEGPRDCGPPFYLLCEDTNPAQQLAYSRRWAASRFGAATPEPPSRPGTARARMRIGYFSPDFHEHATAYLIAEVLELHDRDRFEVFAYSYGPEDRSPMRARLKAAVEHFVDVAWEPDDVVLARMRSDALDVLVDLKGYTMGERLRVLARRPCAVQVTWLGYAGTTGASFIDYVIADPVVIPEAAESAYSERVLRMRNCYQPNDRKRPRPEPLSRAAYGLTDDAFVFCCFNQTVKITPTVWERWVNLLRSVPQSVLWLLEDNRWASDNLKASLADAGVDPARLVVAPRLPMSEHIARYAAADIALDTFPYTSHTTASDALWMGCPLVALCGETFAARVSASLLSACDAAELITYSLDDYERIARRLAGDPEYLRGMRERLAVARDSAPLFDSRGFTRELEALYESIAPQPG